MFMDSCCCFNLKSGSIASGVFTLTTSLVQIFLQIALWTSSSSITDIDQYINFDGDNIAWTLYIILGALDVLLILFSVILIWGVEKEMSRSPLVPWLGFLPVYLVTEAGINIYYVVMNIDNNLQNWNMTEALKIYGSKGLVITFLIYWCLKLVINTTAMFCVVSRYQQLGEMIKTRRKLRLPSRGSLEYPYRSARRYHAENHLARSEDSYHRNVYRGYDVTPAYPIPRHYRTSPGYVRKAPSYRGARDFTFSSRDFADTMARPRPPRPRPPRPPPPRLRYDTRF